MKVHISLTVDIDPQAWYEFDLGEPAEGPVRPAYVSREFRAWIDAQITLLLAGLGLLREGGDGK